jgi:hypothetical protein
MKNVFIGDIKAGVIEDWRVRSSPKKVETLLQSKIISSEEANVALKLLKDSSSVGKLKAKQELKFHIIRWTPEQILKGKQELRDGRTYTLEEAFSSPTITKLDTIALVNERYTEFSIIYEFHNGSEALNEDIIDPEKTLKDSIKLYKAKGIGSKSSNASSLSLNSIIMSRTLRSITQSSTSEAGKLYIILTDVKVLGDLLELHQLPSSQVTSAISGFKDRLNTIYEGDTHLKGHSGLLNDLHKASQASKPRAIHILRHSKDQLQDILNDTTKLKGGYVPYKID